MPKTILILFRALRVYQWTKNLLVLAALIFAKQVLIPGQVAKSLEALAAFCMAASATYLFNDFIDIEKDRAHPEKCNRPLASGELSVGAAWALIVLLITSSLVLAYAVRLEFLYALLVYMGLTLSYTLVLKDLIIIDVMTVALGFVVRAMAGAVALDVAFSNWLVICTFFLALFLGLSKRRHEITIMNSDDAHTHRRVLYHYSVPYLDQLILVMAGGALLTYTIYTCSPDVVNNFGTDKLYVTVPFVVYGLFRYFFLVHHRTGGGDPSRTLLQDWPLGINVLLWGIACVVIIYVWGTGDGVPTPVQ